MNLQMLNRSKKVSCNREFSNSQHELRSLALPIQIPVLDQYNYIDLRKNHNRRIDHVVVKELPLLTKSFSNDSSQRDRWEKSLDKYILARQKLENRKASSNNAFQFLKLNKINKYRKQKLLEAQSLPISIINTANVQETYSFSLTQTQYGFKYSPKNKSGSRRLSTDAHMESPKEKTQVKRVMFNRYQQQERIMNSLLENYFKKKYSHSSSSQVPQKVKNQKYSSAILRKYKKKYYT